MSIIIDKNTETIGFRPIPDTHELCRIHSKEFEEFIKANKYFINAFDEIYSDRNSDDINIDNMAHPVINTYFKRKPKKQSLVFPIRQYDFDSYILETNIICKRTPLSIVKEIKDKKEYLIDMKNLGELKHIVIDNRYDIYYKNYIRRRIDDVYGFWDIIDTITNRYGNRLVILKDRKSNKEKRFMFNYFTLGGYPNLIYPDKIEIDDLEICKKAFERI
jgi:hypothetical protein